MSKENTATVYELDRGAYLINKPTSIGIVGFVDDCGYFRLKKGDIKIGINK